MSCEIGLLKTPIFFFFLFSSSKNKGSWLIRVYNSHTQTLMQLKGTDPGVSSPGPRTTWEHLYWQRQREDNRAENETLSLLTD